MVLPHCFQWTLGMPPGTPAVLQSIADCGTPLLLGFTGLRIPDQSCAEPVSVRQSKVYESTREFNDVFIVSPQ
jgi:hypothetical protein